ncbi:MAG: hypothetical protein ACRCYY_12355 [Trueperaceae bacterium]
MKIQKAATYIVSKPEDTMYTEKVGVEVISWHENHRTITAHLPMITSKGIGLEPFDKNRQWVTLEKRCGEAKAMVLEAIDEKIQLLQDIKAKFLAEMPELEAFVCELQQS